MLDVSPTILDAVDIAGHWQFTGADSCFQNRQLAILTDEGQPVGLGCKRAGTPQVALLPQLQSSQADCAVDLVVPRLGRALPQ